MHPPQLAVSPRPDPPAEADLQARLEAAERRSDEAAAALERALAERDRFHAKVSHDLRNPLGAIRNLALVLSAYGDQLDEIGRDCLRRIERSVRAAESLADGIDAYVRGGGPVRPEPVPMRALFEQEAARLASLHGGAARVAIDGDLPDANADPDMMRAVVAHLLGNAFKFVRSGQSAEVEIGGSDAGGEHVYCVRDRGIGIDARWADRLFQPFERLHGSPDYAGHGLGLAAVARIVHRHGGRVWAEGARDAGAAFFFALPKR